MQLPYKEAVTWSLIRRVTQSYDTGFSVDSLPRVCMWNCVLPPALEAISQSRPQRQRTEHAAV